MTRLAVPASLVAALALFLAGWRLHVGRAHRYQGWPNKSQPRGSQTTTSPLRPPSPAGAAASEHGRLGAAYTRLEAFPRQRCHDLLRLVDHCSRAAEDRAAAASEMKELEREHQEVARK